MPSRAPANSGPHRTSVTGPRRPKEQRADTRDRGDRVDVFQAVDRLDHDRREKVAFRIERPDVGMTFVFRGAEPQIHIAPAGP